MTKPDEQLKALTETQLAELHRIDKETWYRAWRLQNDPSFVLSEKEKTLKEREKAFELAEREKALKRREDALNAPVTLKLQAPPVQRVSPEAISKEMLEQICEKRGLKQRQFTDEEMKRLKVKRDATPKDIALLRSRIWDDWLIRARDSETLRKPVPQFLLLAAREMLEVELFVLRNELETKVGTDRVGELLMQLAEIQRDIADLKQSRDEHAYIG
jgi:hypothetical protein